MKNKNKRVRKNNLKRGFKKSIKNIPFKILRECIYIIVGLTFSIYLLIRSFDNYIAKMFMELPRLGKVLIIYTLIFSALYNNTKPPITEEKVIIKYETIYEETKQEDVCNLDHETSCKIKNKAIEYGIDWKIAVSISIWETGNYTSNIYLNKNNVGGLYCDGFLSFNTLDDGIDAFVRNLKKNYFDMGLDTFEKIQPKYCPIGAENDPKGLNKNWLNGVIAVSKTLEEVKNG